MVICTITGPSSPNGSDMAILGWSSVVLEALEPNPLNREPSCLTDGTR